ncbi:MAG: tetratricopeptide repeat protein [Planctomycetaceae bacterium]
MTGLAVLLGGLVIGVVWQLDFRDGSGDSISGDSISGDSITGLSLAKQHLVEGRLDLAEAALQSHLQRFPNSAEALEELRWLYFNQFRTREIEELLEAHLARYPKDIAAAIELLNCEFRKQLPREGIGYLRDVDRKQPGQSSVQLALGYCHWQIGELDEARTAFQTALAQRRDHRETCNVVAEFLLEEGEIEAAAELVKDREDDQAWFLRSLIAEQHGDVEAAYRAIANASSQRPGELRYVHREGLLLKRLGRHEEATRRLHRANELEGFQTELSEIVMRGRHTEPTPEMCERLADLLHEFAREVPSRCWRQFGS